MSELQSIIAAVKEKAEELVVLVAGNLPHNQTLTELAGALHDALADIDGRVAAIETAAKADLSALEDALTEKLTAFVNGKIDTFAQGVTSTLQSHMSQVQQAVTIADNAHAAVAALQAIVQPSNTSA
ncbi:hypothetical protein WI28_23095 [Burkholderia diffusa]|uniref:Uncharacterized protein n=1 Tax=Burkholderia cepacia TaxID=292 RepID=A0A103ZU70_BURCE|nr:MULTISPECIES: hypothetical protein [Burkholderia cepacia complex]KUZ07011.1 hypothetical protein WI28_23095 [Burkholderia diffusa]KVK86196.1 hypothetical protein WS90_07960 [Burkholderia cepacia]